jgi:hypothetical protein
MWRTSCGERTLSGAEARVFAEALLCLLDEALMDRFEDYFSGVNCFDDLTYGQKVAVLVTVGKGLLCPDVPAEELTAALEGAIAAVFEKLREIIMLEIDEPELGTPSRNLVVAARQAMEGEEIPSPTYRDRGEWDLQIQELADAILWDADYEDGYLYLDRPPEEARALREMTRVTEEYYLFVPDDLTGEVAKRQLAELRSLATPIAEGTAQDVE